MAADRSITTAVAVLGFIPRRRKFERAGLPFEANWVADRIVLGLSPAPIYRHSGSGSNSPSNDSSESSDAEEDDSRAFDVDDMKYFKYLNKLDPNDKGQDHYKVLGISKLRHSASESQIRRAYRSKLINHHPDKRRANGLAVSDDKEDYFTCITRAYEQLSVPLKRRSYDSVDPKFDNTVPTDKTVKSMADFYKLFEPVFLRNSRFSTLRDVPDLGTVESSHEHVELFYSFWFDFQTWREFSYEDEEESEKGENRAERRWLDRDNKKVRQEKRSDEVKRIRGLVELAYNNDPRVAAFKKEQKRHKEEYKQAKKDAAKAKRLQEEEVEDARVEAERIAKEHAAAETKRVAELEKKERERKKKVLRGERKKLKAFMEERQYMSDDQADVRAQNEDAIMRICDHLDALQLADFVDRLSTADDMHTVFTAEVASVDASLNRLIDPHSTSRPIFNGTPAAPSAAMSWTEEEVKLLVKATGLFPVGTQSRWQVIAEFINEHIHRNETGGKTKIAKDVIAKAKEFQANDAHKAPMSTPGLVQNKHHLTVLAPETTKIEEESTPLEESNMTGRSAWSTGEQKLLEQALKTHGASTKDRWDRIAECLPGRSKKECVRRYKELAEMIKSKRAAQKKVAKGE